MTHSHKHSKSKNHWFRMDVPKRLQALAGTTSWKKSLGTSDPNVAAIKRAQLTSYYKAEVVRLDGILAGAAQKEARDIVDRALEILAARKGSLDLVVRALLTVITLRARQSWSSEHARDASWDFGLVPFMTSEDFEDADGDTSREISEDVGVSPLFHISTIHSFLWSVIRPFQGDIATWVGIRIGEKIAERREHYEKPRTQARTKARLEIEIAELEAQLDATAGVEKFTYGTGSSYAEGILGHDDVLKLTPYCVEAHPLLRRVVASRFPFVFVDESQDTNPEVVEALRSIAAEQPRLCVGFFGDPMQKIYMSGTGAVTLGQGWAEITKPENFRCPTTVLSVVNAIRAAGDGLVQTRGRMAKVGEVEQPVPGTANLFILPADNQRSARLAAVRTWLATETGDELWLSDLSQGDVRLLVLVHRMAATRLGFPNLFSALNDRAPSSFAEGIADASAWPLRPVAQQILPMVTAAREGDRFTVMSILRRASPKLERDRLRGQPAAPVLAGLQQAVDALVAMLAEDSQATVGEVMRHIRDTELLRLDDRFAPHLVDEPVDDGSTGFANVQAFLACQVSELWAYRRYYTEESPFATHHGVKGAQFERVLVVVDDEEAAFHQYSYGKYFGYVALSDNDQARIDAGEETVLDRTRRLFYVCCSRAVKDLAVVLFVPDVPAALAAITEKNLFPEASIRGVDALV